MRKRSEVAREEASLSQAEPAPERPRLRCYNAVWTGSHVTLLERLESGEVATHKVKAEYSGFVPIAQLPLVEKHLRRSPRVRGYSVEGQWVRVRFASWHDRADFCKPDYRPPLNGRSLAQTLGFDFHEADLNPVRRFMADNDVEIQAPRRCFLDIEADSDVPFSRKEDMRIFCWAVVDDETGEEHTGIIEADTDAEESELLAALFKVLERYDQVAAWHGGEMKEDGDGFDFPTILARLTRRGLDVDLRRWLWIDHLAHFRKMNVTASESGDEKASFGLDFIARSVLGEDEGKLAETVVVDGVTYTVDGSISRLLWEHHPEVLERYCVRDTTRLRLIEKETGYLAVLDELCATCGTFPDNVGMKPVQYVESFALRVARQNGLRLRSNWRVSGGGKFKGAYVQEPTETGLLRNVHVFDFSGMYPSIMQTWNMSPETHVPEAAQREPAARPAYLAHVKDDHCSAPRPEGTCVAPGTGEVFRLEPRGIVPLCIDQLRANRKKWDDLRSTYPPGTPEWKQCDRRSTSMKQINNSFYGVGGSPFSRIYVREVAESVTLNGQWLVKMTMSEGEKVRIRSVYGDTDSAMAYGVTEDEFRAFVAWCNTDLYPRAVAECGCTRNEVKLAYEKEFEVLILVGKKRYAGRYRHYKGKRAVAGSKPEIKGFEYKRGDTARLCRKFQERVILDLLATPEHPEFLERAHYVEMVKAERDRILDGDLELRDFVLSKRLSRDPDHYVKRKKLDGDDHAENAHVVVAKRMRELGQEAVEGTRIEYVVIDASDGIEAIPVAEYAPGVEDRYYLWEKLVYPATQRVLEAVFKDHDWDQYRRARPRAPKRGKPVPEEQAAFDFGENPGSRLAASPAHENPEHDTERRAHASGGDSAGRDASAARRDETTRGRNEGGAEDAQQVGGSTRAGEAAEPVAREERRVRRRAASA